MIDLAARKAHAPPPVSLCHGWRRCAARGRRRLGRLLHFALGVRRWGGVHVRGEYLVAPATVVLRPVHREIGVTEQLRRLLLTTGADGDADARRHRDTVSVQGERRRKGLGDAL